MLAACGTTTLRLGNDDAVNSQLAADASDATGYEAPSIDPQTYYLTLDAGLGLVFVGQVNHAGSPPSTIEIDTSPTSFCATGSVGQSSTDYAVAEFNVAQSPDGSYGQVALNANTITVYFTNAGGSPLRLQLGTSSNPTTPWCYDVTDAGATPIALTSFNTECWSNGGESFEAGTQIASIGLEVPASKDGVTTPFNFCFLGLTIQ
jgi:hypothetical protein